MGPGTSVAHYRITEKIGEGGMGAVYRATDTRLHRDVAVKVLPDAFAADADRLARFTREARVLASLNHPNIAAIYGVENGALILELVDGAEPQGPISTVETLRLTHQLIDALEYAHEHNVVHRDLKPANLKVTAEGKLKVLDFGLAKAIGDEAVSQSPESRTLTLHRSSAGLIVGTASYMSPEQARGSRVDHRSDIWAFGAVLYELLTGSRAFPGNTVSDTIANVLTATPNLTGVPQPFQKLLHRCLERDVHQRLGWIGEARVILAEPVAMPPAVPRRRNVVAVGIAAVAGIAAGAAGAKWLGAPVLPASTAPPRFRRLTTDAWAEAPAISPDGKMVAYYARRPDNRSFDLWVQQIGGGAVRLIAAQPFGWRPFFSADGSLVYFKAFRDQGGVYQIPALGGEPQLAIQANQVRYFRPSPDGKWIAYTIEDRLEVKPVSGGSARTIASALGTGNDSGFLWSPDSTRILLSNFPLSDALLEFNVQSTKVTTHDGFRPNLLRRGFLNLNILRFTAWLPGGDIVFTATVRDAVNVWRLPLAHIADAAPTPLTQGAWQNDDAAIAGNRLVFANRRIVNHVWSLPVDWNSGRTAGELSRLTPDLVESQFPDLSPDGTALVYISIRNGVQGVNGINLASGKDRQIAPGSDESPAAYSTFSPDGREVAFGRRGPGWPAYVGAIAGGDIRHIGNAHGRIRGWSKDGKYLLIWAVENRKHTTIALMSIADGVVSDILVDPGKNLGSPRFSPDNRHLVFITQEGEGITVWIAPFHGAQRVPSSEWLRIGLGSMPTWSPDGRSLCYISSEAKTGRFLIARQRLDDKLQPVGEPAELYGLDGFRLPTPVINSMCAGPNRLVFLAAGGTSDIWLMETDTAI